MRKSDQFRIIVFTSPTEIEDEIEKITDLMESGIDMLHLRKPEYSHAQIIDLLESIPSGFHDRIRLHDHFELIKAYNLNGVHFNRRHHVIPQECVNISCSCHSIEEIGHLPERIHWDYVTLSPIYNSISKSGYNSPFNIHTLQLPFTEIPIIGLGGIIPDNLRMLKEKGFSGAALLGYIWEGSFLKKLEALIEARNNLNTI